MRLLQQNIIVLECEDSESIEPNGFIYVSQSTYNEALLLFDRFVGEIGLLKKLLNVTNHIKAIEFFHKHAPDPINSLAPFLGLIREDIEIKEDMEMLCGMLHQMSQTINFNSFTKVPLDIRADVVFSKSILLTYKKSWEDIEVKINLAEVNQESLTMDVIKTIVGEIVETFAEKLSIQGNLVQSNTKQIKSENIDSADPYAEDFDPWSRLNAMFEEVEREDSKEESEKENTTIIDEKEEVTEEKVTEEVIEPEKVNVYDKIAQMYGGI